MNFSYKCRFFKSLLKYIDFINFIETCAIYQREIFITHQENILKAFLPLLILIVGIPCFAAKFNCREVANILSGQLELVEDSKIENSEYRKWFRKSLETEKNDNLTAWGEYLRTTAKESRNPFQAEILYVLKHFKHEEAKKLGEDLTTVLENLLKSSGEEMTEAEAIQATREAILELSFQDSSAWSNLENLKFYMAFQSFLLLSNKRISQRFSLPYKVGKTPSSTSHHAFKDDTVRAIYVGLVPMIGVGLAMYTVSQNNSLPIAVGSVLGMFYSFYHSVRVAIMDNGAFKEFMDRIYYFTWRNPELKSLAKDFMYNQPSMVGGRMLLGKDFESMRPSEADQMRKLFDIYSKVSAKIYAKYGMSAPK